MVYLYKEGIMTKCNGCGAILQTNKPNQEGYIREKNIEKQICERCFRIKNYGDYQMILKNNSDFEPILSEIGATKDLVVFVVDLFMINKDFEIVKKFLKNNILFVFTKRDILPKSVNNQKLINYIENLGINYIDSVMISSYKNDGFDLLMEKIDQYKTTNRVFVVGYTNAGKSTMINHIIYHYSNLQSFLTTSILPSTTLNAIEIPIREDLTLVDTPGLLEENSMLYLVDSKLLKKILPRKEIKPITYQIKLRQTIFIEDLLRIDVNNRNNLTFYFSNSLSIMRTFKKTNQLMNLKEHIIRVKQGEDIVISGLGFIRVSHHDIIKFYTFDLVDIYTRKSLI